MSPLRSFLGRSPVVSAVAYTVVGVLPLYLTAAQAPRVQAELGFGKTTFGVVIAAFYLSSSIASRRVGPRLDRLGPSPGLRASATLTVVSAGLIAVFARDWVTMACFLAVSGLANAFGQVASNLVIASGVGPARQGVAFAAKQAAVPAGAMLAGLAIPWVGGGVSWRLVYVIAAVAALVMFLGVPRYRPVATEGVTHSHRLTPELMAFMFAAAIGGGVGNSMASFISDASVTQGFDDRTAALMLTLGSMVAIVARIGAGLTADRRRKTGVQELIVLLAVAVVGLAVLASAGRSSAVYVVGVILAFLGGWGWQGVMFYAVVRIIRMPAATSTGAVAAGAYLGTVLAPPLLGFGVERMSYEFVFASAAALMTLALGGVIASYRLSLRSPVDHIEGASG